jgi:hypothetical protein
VDNPASNVRSLEYSHKVKMEYHARPDMLYLCILAYLHHSADSRRGFWDEPSKSAGCAPMAHTSSIVIFHLPGTPLMCIGLPYQIRDSACIYRVRLNWGKLRSVSCLR